jgi:uncharacterized iron-regulated membrane protein
VKTTRLDENGSHRPRTTGFVSNLFRKTIFWLHLAAGVMAGSIILVMSATGVLLTYQKQMQSWADLRGLDGSAPSATATVLPVERLIASAKRAKDAMPTAVRWRNSNDAPVEVVFGREGSVFVNAYSGAVLSTGAEGMRAFFRGVTDWHRWLAREGEARESGKKITGAANLLFLFIVMSGFYLWFPRNRTRSAFRNVSWFRGGLRAKARDFNWHNVIGFWSLVPLFIIVVSGVVISYPWASNLVYKAVGEAPPPPQNAAPARAENDRKEKPKQLELATVEPLIVRAKSQDNGWRLLTMQLEPAKGGGVTFNVDRGNGGQPQKRATLVLASSGEVQKWEPFSAGSKGRQLRSILRFAHTGEVLGVPGQTVAGLVTAGTLVLVYTGIALALRRLFAWRRRADEPRAYDAPRKSARRNRKKVGEAA